MRHTSNNPHRGFSAGAIRRGFLLIALLSTLLLPSGLRAGEQENLTGKTAAREEHQGRNSVVQLDPSARNDDGEIVIDKNKLEELGKKAYLTQGRNLGGTSGSENISLRSKSTSLPAPGARAIPSSQERDLSSISANFSQADIRRAIDFIRKKEARKRLRALESGPLERRMLQQEIGELQKRRRELQGQLTAGGQVKPTKKK